MNSNVVLPLESMSIAENLEVIDVVGRIYGKTQVKYRYLSGIGRFWRIEGELLNAAGSVILTGK